MTFFQMFMIHIKVSKMYIYACICIYSRNTIIYYNILAKHPPSAGFPSPSGGAAPSAAVKEKKCEACGAPLGTAESTAFGGDKNKIK